MDMTIRYVQWQLDMPYCHKIVSSLINNLLSLSLKVDVVKRGAALTAQTLPHHYVDPNDTKTPPSY